MTDGDNWTNDDGWGQSYDLGTWYGVSTDGEGRVVGLDLQDNNLTGQIPPDLGDLARLRVAGSLTQQPARSGSAPSSAASAAWNSLHLNDNRLAGEIPAEFGGLGSLEYLDLNNNELTGRIPAELGSLGSLELPRPEQQRVDGQDPSGTGSASAAWNTSIWAPTS